MASKPDDFLSRVFAAKSTEESRTLYDQWAKSYDSDMITHDFTAPRLVAETVAKHLPNIPSLKAKILDAGCGSGAVGIALSKLFSYQVIDGLDISQGMLDVARKTGVYRELEMADLTKRLEREDGVYDAVVCCGMFTHGHLGPEPLGELVRVVKGGGVVAATVLDTFWEESGFEGVVERLTKEGKVEVLGKEVVAYRKDAGGGRVLVLRKL
ncbi:S-adenosyl-L-methionine-dependent methyltransferase [Lentithecium fluviatile CBS 122367]|uniref:S-adenosyl-L-methionine-dependent methyltransferase n=1 Tax=Lentithecium fluviatile CBS 122367 TaxID=1168545 RepID=A0A6G1JJU0_9PLEO|nr:S-adenosyl-L-methionine-dependent methyltransferase [Lentithecium fluviatile CBS 122367]